MRAGTDTGGSIGHFVRVRLGPGDEIRQGLVRLARALYDDIGRAHDRANRNEILLDIIAGI